MITNSKGYLLQFGIILLVLLSLFPTFINSESKEQNNSWINYLKKSTRLQSFIWCILILLITHIIKIWKDKYIISVNIFWYRFAEIILSTIIYIVFIQKESKSISNDDDDDE